MVAASPLAHQRLDALHEAVQTLARREGGPCTLGDCLHPACRTHVRLPDDLAITLTPLTAPAAEPLWLLEWPCTDHDRVQQAQTASALRLLREVGRALNSSLVLEDIFEALGDVLREEIPHDDACIVILEPSGNGVKMLIRLNRDGVLEISGEKNAFAGYDPVIDHMARTPSPAILTRQTLGASRLFRDAVASALVTPLVNKGVLIGLMALGRESSAPFAPQQLKSLADVAEQVAVVVENASLYWQSQTQASRELLINQLTRAIRQSLEIDAILGAATRELGQVLGVSRCYIQYAPPGADTPSQVYSYELPGVAAIAPEELARVALERAVFDERLRRDPASQDAWNPFVLNDVRDAPAFLPCQAFFERHGVQSLVVFPLLIRDQLVGTLTMHQCDAFRVWTMADIDLLKAIAEHLGVALHQAQLFGELAQRTQALERTLGELQQAQIHLIQSEKMAVLGQFVAGIAHEVNTPLGAIAANEDTLRACIEKLRGVVSDSDAQRWLASMDTLLGINRLACERMVEIVRNLRNFARLDESERKAVDLRENIDSALLLAQTMLVQQGIALEKRYHAALPRVECFPGLLNQVVMNLLVNAVHALEGKADGRILIEADVDDTAHTAVIRVSDNGRGIAPTHLPRIFDPGFTTKGVGVGTGLGLALCYKIIEKHNGHIRVTSEEGAGACFEVHIPLRQPPQQATGPTG